MNAFGEALNLVFMRGSGDFSSGSMPMEWISDCIPMSPYSSANESQTAFPWVPIPQPMNLWMLEFKFPCLWTQDSDCIPMSSYLPAKFLESFGWVPPMSCHPDSGMPIEAKKIAFWRDLRGAPIHTTWVPLKSIVEHFRALLRDFCFWANFLGFPNRKKSWSSTR